MQTYSACTFGYLEVVQGLLRESSYYPEDAWDDDEPQTVPVGTTPLAITRMAWHRAIVELLQRAGVRE